MSGSDGPGHSARVLLQGDVQLQRKGAAQPRHLVLWEDHFSFFASEEAFSAQQRPRAEVPLDALLGVKVGEDTVTLSLSDRELSFCTAGRNDAQGWGRAFNEARSQQAATAEEAEPEGSQLEPLCLHEGELTMQQTANPGQRDAWLAPVSGSHFVLYRDRLEWFHTPAAMEGGRPDGRIEVEDIVDLEVQDTQVALESKDGMIRVLQEEQDGDMQSWIASFEQILETDEHYEPAGGPPRCVHEGQLYLAVGQGQVEPRHVVLYGDKIDFFNDQAESDAGGAPTFSIETADVCRLSILDDGFVLGLDDEQLELSVPPDADFEAWASAFRSVMEAAEGASAEPRPALALSSPMALSSASTAATATAFSSKTHAAAEQPLWQEMEDPRVASWWEAARRSPTDPAHFHGVLWLQRAQRQLPRFCVLYTDRIDSWISPLEAVRRQPPEGRIMLADVRGLTTIGGGFVMNLRGRKIGIYIEDAAYRQGWTTALQGLLDMEGNNDQAWSPTRSAPLLSPPSPSPLAAPGQPFIPRVASLPSPRSELPAQSLRSAVDDRYHLKPHSPKERICAPQFPLDPNAFVHRPEGSKAVAAKVNSPATKIPKDKTTSRPSVAEKVSAPRFISPREHAGEIASKITGFTSPRERAPKGEGPLAPNVGAADRVPLRQTSPTTRAGHFGVQVGPKGLVGKITGSEPRCRSPRCSVTGKITSN